MISTMKKLACVSALAFMGAAVADEPDSGASSRDESLALKHAQCVSVLKFVDTSDSSPVSPNAKLKALMAQRYHTTVGHELSAKFDAMVAEREKNFREPIIARHERGERENDDEKLLRFGIAACINDFANQDKEERAPTRPVRGTSPMIEI